MNADMMIAILREGLMLALTLALPILCAVFVVGALAALLQAVTGVQDVSIGAVPRLIVTLLALAIAAPWIADHLVAFSSALMGSLGEVQTGGVAQGGP